MKITKKSKTKDRKDETILTGQMVDQAALSGLLNTLYEFQLTLLSVKLVKDEK